MNIKGFGYKGENSEDDRNDSTAASPPRDPPGGKDDQCGRKSLAWCRPYNFLDENGEAIPAWASAGIFRRANYLGGI